MHLINNNKQFYMYAAKHYYSLDSEEFDEDIKRFKYVKRLVNRYNQTGTMQHRLILNHLTVLFNVFGIDPTLKMMEYKLGLSSWSIIKPFLIYMKAIKVDQYTETKMDHNIIDLLRKT